MNLKTFRASALLIFTLTPALHAEELDITINNAWIAEAPPVSKVMAAYMTIVNHSNETVTINKAESSSYSSIEFHETIHRDGTATMVQHRELQIPANGSLQLSRGAKHFMLFNPVNYLKAGEAVSITLSTKNNKTKTVIVNVKKAQY